MSGHFINFRSSRFHYYQWGKGVQILFAFHGYGESGASFAFLAEAVGRDFTIIGLDMPFHGKTEWKEEKLFLDPRDLRSLMLEIASGLPEREVGWWLLGYSMGGRVALQLLELEYARVERLVLMAPDGLIVNPWYWLATRTAAGNRFFRWTMKRPGWLFLLMRAGNRLGLVNPSLFKFAARYIDDDPVRQELYQRWTVMRGFRPPLGSIAGWIRELKIPIVLLYGRYDRIILARRGERFLHRIRPNGRLTLLPAGHAILQPKFVEVITNALNLPPS
ncbi:MAG TPA: alpha/beta hydrolase [Puia sp.]|uniref:alpha/beta fold hydrolase n=1 Tax=Puia sp. TaxID=2045100 RepID=UPI002C02FF0A|nr:alpha/beta hydrolase [Puia sp.]HVU97127.1 alpha/beta hydrolase [Puia sp.]